MNTEDMIRTMAADEMLEPPVESALPRALAVGGLASVALFLVVLGPRPDLGEAFARSAVLLKPILGLALAGTGTFAVLRAARPGADPSHRLPMLWLAPTLAALAIAGALWSLPPDRWATAIAGQPGSLLDCLLGVPLMSLPFLAAALHALRQGASLRPRLTGALAGLLGGGLGVVIYGFYCIEDSPLFYGVWYSVGVAVITLLGASLGARVLRF